MTLRQKFFYACFFIFLVAVYFLTSAGNTPYNYFSRLADAFLHGRYYLTDNPSWLSELIPAEGNRFFVVYPPMPAFLLLPFNFIFKHLFQQQYLAHLLGAGAAVITGFVFYQLTKNLKTMLWGTLFCSLGTIVWYLSATGSAWYLGQISACFFVSLAILEKVGKNRGVILGILLGAAFISRLQTILLLPFFLYPFSIRRWWFLFLAMTPFFLINFGYNLLRFGSIFDKAYVLIPGLFNEPWYQNGLFSLKNIPNHLKIAFGSFPIFFNSFPYIQPSWSGLSIWITTPGFIYVFFNKLTRETLSAWLSIILISILIFSHGTTGFTQFGYRFAVDFYPLLFYLLAKSLVDKSLKWHHWTLLTIGILVNLWGVLWINIFNWVRF